MSAKPRTLWSWQFVVVIGVNFIIAMVFYILMTTMALYAVTRFAANETVAGLTASAYVIGAVGSRLLTGKYLDFVGRRRTIIIAMAGFAAFSLTYLIASDIGVLIGMRFIHGLSFGMASTAISVAAVSLIPVARRGEGMGFYSLAATLAIGIGPLLGTVLIDEAGYDAIFWAATGISVVGLAIALLLKVPERTPSDEERRAVRRIRFTDIIDRGALPISVVTFMACFSQSGVLAFYLNYAAETGDASVAGLYFAVYSIVVLFVRIIGGRIQDRFGDNAVFYPILVVFAIGMLVLSLPPSPTIAVVGGILLAIGFGTVMPSGNAIAVSSSSPARVGVATSTFFVMADGAIGIGPIVLGTLLPLTGYSGMYSLLAVVVALSIVAYYFLHGHKKAGPATRQ